MGQVMQTIRNTGLFVFGMAMIVVGYKVNEVHAQEKLEQAKVEAEKLDAEKLEAEKAKETAVGMEEMEAGKKKTAEKEKSKAKEKAKAKKKSKLEKAKPEKAHASK